MLFTSVSQPDYKTIEAGQVVGLDLYDVARHFRAASPAKDNSDFCNFFEYLNSFNTLWYYPGCFELSYSFLDLCDPAERFIKRQLDAVIYHIECLIDVSRISVDRPSRQRHWANKLNQLYLFSTLDFVHNVPTKVAAHSGNNSNPSILKHISETREIRPNLSVYAQVITPKIAEIFSNSPCPYVIQDRIFGNFEYRAMFFGNNYIIISIDRRTLVDEVDIHTLNDLKNFVLSTDLNPLLLSSLLKLRKLIDINVLAIDFFIENERIVPLEINSQFSWAWLPASTIAKISEIVFEFLTNPRGAEYG